MVSYHIGVTLQLAFIHSAYFQDFPLLIHVYPLHLSQPLRNVSLYPFFCWQLFNFCMFYFYTYILHAPQCADVCIEKTWLSAHCPCPSATLSCEPRSVRRSSRRRSRTMSLMSWHVPPVGTEGEPPWASGPAAWAHQNLLEGFFKCTRQGRVWAGRTLCLSHELPGVLLLLSSHLGKHCARVAEPTCAVLVPVPRLPDSPAVLPRVALWAMRRFCQWNMGSCCAVSFLMLSNVTLQYLCLWQECNVVVSLWFNLHFPWLLARLQIFSCLLNNGFACSYYLLMFIIDLFDFLLTFFVGYMCWEIAPGGRLPFSLVYALLFGKEC